jgi:hypothetical protein
MFRYTWTINFQETQWKALNWLLILVCWNHHAIGFVKSAIFVIVITRLDLIGVTENKIKNKNQIL